MRLLSSTIIEEISRHSQSASSLAIAYFYFDFHDTDTRLHAVLRSLVEQISLQCPNTPDALMQLFSDNAEGCRSPTAEELTSTVKSIIGTFGSVYVIFDALDECPQREELLALLETMHDWGLSTLHLLATSRPEQDIEQNLGRIISHEIVMYESLVDGDIRIHVSKTLDDDNKFQMYSKEEKHMIESALIKGAHGM